MCVFSKHWLFNYTEKGFFFIETELRKERRTHTQMPNIWFRSVDEWKLKMHEYNRQMMNSQMRTRYACKFRQKSHFIQISLLLLCQCLLSRLAFHISHHTYTPLWKERRENQHTETKTKRFTPNVNYCYRRRAFTNFIFPIAASALVARMYWEYVTRFEKLYSSFRGTKC